MKLIDDSGSLAPAALAAVIAHSQIIVATPVSPATPAMQAAPARQYPPGFDDVDIAMLDWIAAEGRRLGRRFVRM